MTYIETIVGGILLAVFTGMLGLLLGRRGRVSEDEFDRHVKAPLPHIACPVHASKLEGIEKKLDRIDDKIDKLLETR